MRVAVDSAEIPEIVRLHFLMPSNDCKVFRNKNGYMIFSVSVVPLAEVMVENGEFVFNFFDWEDSQSFKSQMEAKTMDLERKVVNA